MSLKRLGLSDLFVRVGQNKKGVEEISFKPVRFLSQFVFDLGFIRFRLIPDWRRFRQYIPTEV